MRGYKAALEVHAEELNQAKTLILALEDRLAAEMAENDRLKAEQALLRDGTPPAG